MYPATKYIAVGKIILFQN